MWQTKRPHATQNVPMPHLKECDKIHVNISCDRYKKWKMRNAIQAGDTFFNLATKFCTTVTAIAEANPDVDPNFLQIGQIICIPI
jgi:hypothetical protein